MSEEEMKLNEEAETVNEEVKEEAAETAEAEATSAEVKEDKKEKKAKKSKKDPRDEKIAELEDKVIRQLAEFQNFRNRTEREKQQMFEVGAKSVIEKILPTIDNFERGLSTVSEEQKNDAFVQGIDKVYRQMLTELEAIGVKPMDAQGKPFDPNLHNAVMQVASEELEPGTVAQELQKGYMYRDTVVRHAMVSVVQEQTIIQTGGK